MRKDRTKKADDPILGLYSNAHVAILEGIISRKDAIESELRIAAKNLCKEANELLNDAKWTRYGKQIGLATRNHRTYFGPRIVWVSYTRDKHLVLKPNNKTEREEAAKAAASANTGTHKAKHLRFTREIPGRENGRYPDKIFRQFAPELRDSLIAIEHRAGDLRALTSEYRALLKWAEAEAIRHGITTAKAGEM